MSSLFGVDSFTMVLAVGMMALMLLLALAKGIILTWLYRVVMKRLHRARPRFVPAVAVLFLFQAVLVFVVGGHFVTGAWLFGHVPGYELSSELDRVYRTFTTHTALWQIGHYAVMVLLLTLMSQMAHRRELRHQHV
jgi:hypothetical protein